MTWRAVALMRDSSSMQLEGESVAGLLSRFADLLGGPPFDNVLRLAFVHVLDDPAPALRGRELAAETPPNVHANPP